MSLVSGIDGIGASWRAGFDTTGAEAPLDVRVTNFEAALKVVRGGQGDAVASADEGARLAQASSPGATDATTPNDASRDRALRALGFEEAAPPNGGNAAGGPPVATGDTILEGLKQLRGAFDEQATSLAKMNETGAMGASEMLALQVEVVKYGMLIDVTSKLTGKSTQAFDTLLKGQ